MSSSILEQLTPTMPHVKRARQASGRVADGRHRAARACAPAEEESRERISRRRAAPRYSAGYRRLFSVTISMAKLAADATHNRKSQFQQIKDIFQDIRATPDAQHARRTTCRYFSAAICLSARRPPCYLRHTAASWRTPRFLAAWSQRMLAGIAAKPTSACATLQQ